MVALAAPAALAAAADALAAAHPADADRIRRAARILAAGLLTDPSGIGVYHVRSEARPADPLAYYVVSVDDCDCPDHAARGRVCKHMWAARLAERRAAPAPAPAAPEEPMLPGTARFAQFFGED
jgi:hypothetical protein